MQGLYHSHAVQEHIIAHARTWNNPCSTFLDPIDSILQHCETYTGTTQVSPEKLATRLRDWSTLAGNFIGIDPDTVLSYVHAIISRIPDEFESRPQHVTDFSNSLDAHPQTQKEYVIGSIAQLLHDMQRKNEIYEILSAQGIVNESVRNHCFTFPSTVQAACATYTADPGYWDHWFTIQERHTAQLLACLTKYPFLQDMMCHTKDPKTNGHYIQYGHSDFSRLCDMLGRPLAEAYRKRLSPQRTLPIPALQMGHLNELLLTYLNQHDWEPRRTLFLPAIAKVTLEHPDMNIFEMKQCRSILIQSNGDEELLTELPERPTMHLENILHALELPDGIAKAHGMKHIITIGSWDDFEARYHLQQEHENIFLEKLKAATQTLDEN